MSSKRITLVLGILLVTTFSYIGYTDAVRTWQNLQEQEQQIESLNIEQQELGEELDKTKETTEQSQAEIKKLEQEKQRLEEERIRLEKELQAKAEARARIAAASDTVINQATLTSTVNASGDCGDNQYAAYIYGMESGGRVAGNCNPLARNASGCLGIGQACPGTKLTAVCPSLDYACENRFFTEYAMNRYGSWANAYAFHVANGWW